MKQILCALLVILSTIVTCQAKTQPAVIFSQDVVAINADGSILPSVKIEPGSMSGMQTYDFDLGRQRLLRIETNLDNAYERGLAEIVATVERCYSYVEKATGHQLNRGVLLYLIEMDEIPYAYNFKASYNDASLWSEVRLALINKGAPLSGEYAPTILTDLLYDTLPHELGHDILNSISNLSHDIDGSASNHTRWFIEGVCEVLAKGFSLRESPDLHKRLLALRNIDIVLAAPESHTAMLKWAQDNNNGMAFESDLYGAAMLTLMEWTKDIQLSKLLKQLKKQERTLKGDDLVALMVQTTGAGPAEMLSRAHSHGLDLNEKMILAKNGI